MMDDLPFRTRAIWDSDCGIVLLDGTASGSIRYCSQVVFVDDCGSGHIRGICRGAQGTTGHAKLITSRGMGIWA